MGYTLYTILFPAFSYLFLKIPRTIISISSVATVTSELYLGAGFDLLILKIIGLIQGPFCSFFSQVLWMFLNRFIFWNKQHKAILKTNLIFHWSLNIFKKISLDLLHWSIERWQMIEAGWVKTAWLCSDAGCHTAGTLLNLKTNMPKLTKRVVP